MMKAMINNEPKLQEFKDNLGFTTTQGLIKIYSWLCNDCIPCVGPLMKQVL